MIVVAIVACSAFPPSLSDLKEKIASQTKIPAANQNLFYNTENLEEIVGPTLPISDYPETSLDTPVIILSQYEGSDFPPRDTIGLDMCLNGERQ